MREKVFKEVEFWILFQELILTFILIHEECNETIQCTKYRLYISVCWLLFADDAYLKLNKEFPKKYPKIKIVAKYTNVSIQLKLASRREVLKPP